MPVSQPGTGSPSIGDKSSQEVPVVSEPATASSVVSRLVEARAQALLDGTGAPAVSQPGSGYPVIRAAGAARQYGSPPRESKIVTSVNGQTGDVILDTSGIFNPFSQEFQVPSATWTVNHNLGYHPSVRIVDSGGNVIIADIQDIDAYTVIVSFSGANTGWVYCS